MDIKDIRLATNMTQKGFADYFNIPVRTLQDWEAEKRTPPAYVVELIKYKIKKERLGMLRLIEKDHGKVKVLFEGGLAEVVEYLQNNKDLMNWVNDEDPDMELPELDEVETLRELEFELNKIDLSWWCLEVEEVN